MPLALTEVNRALTSLSQDNPEDKERFKTLLQDVKYWYAKYQTDSIAILSSWEKSRLLEEKLAHGNTADIENNYEQIIPTLKTFFTTLCEKKDNFFLVTPKDSTQQWILDRMQALGYPYTHDDKGIIKGHCYGIAHMGAQAFLANDIEHFNERLSIIESIPVEDYQNNFAGLRQRQAQLERDGARDEAEEIDALMIDIKAFFDGISLLQNADNDQYKGFHENTAPIQVANKILPIVCPSSLDSPGERPVHVKSVIGAYSKAQLSQYITLLEKSLGNQSFSLVFMSANHEINLNYNHLTKQWLFIDSNQLPGDIYLHSDLIADAILEAFTFSIAKRDGIVTFTEMYIPEKQKEQFDDDFSTLEQQETWHDMHALTNENLTERYRPDPFNQITYALTHANHPDILEAASKVAPDELKREINNWSFNSEPKKRILFVQMMLEKLDKDSAKALYKIFHLFCNKENKKTMLSSAIAFFPQWITSGQDFSDLILQHEADEKIIIYEVCKARLFECIQSAYDFSCALQYLNEPKQRSELFDTFKERLKSDWIQSVDDFVDAIKCLKVEERSELFDTFKAPLESWIKSGSDFGRALCFLKETERSELLNKVKILLVSEWIQSANDFKNALQYLKEAERSEVFNAVKVQLISEWINDTHTLNAVFQYLTASERKEVFHAVKVRLVSEWMSSASDFYLIYQQLEVTEKAELFDIAKERLFSEWISSVYDFVRVRQNIAATEKELLFKRMAHRLPGLTEEYSEYMLVLAHLQPDEQIIFISNAKEKLSRIITAAHVFISILQELKVPEVKHVFIDAMLTYLPILTNSGWDLSHILKQVAGAYHADILGVVQHKILLIISDTFALLDILECVPSNKERAIVFDALEDKLSELMDEAKIFEQEELIQFYDEWVSGRDEDKTYSLGSS